MSSIRTSLSLAALLASTTFVQAAEPLPYEANFDSSGGVELGALEGQRGWNVDEGKAVITDGEGREGSRALRVESPDPSVPLELFQNVDTVGIFPRAIYALPEKVDLASCGKSRYLHRSTSVVGWTPASSPSSCGRANLAGQTQ